MSSGARPLHDVEPPGGGQAPRTGRLYFRFLAISVPVQAAILMAMAALFLSSQSAASEEEQTNSWNRTARHVSVVLSQNLLDSNYEDAERFLRGLSGEADIVDCALYDREGEKLIGATRDGVVSPAVPPGLIAAATAKRANAFRRDPSAALEFVAVPIDVGGRTRGIAVIALSTAAQDARIASLRERLALASIAFIVAGILVAVALARYVSRPVADLAVAAGRLATGDYDLSVDNGRSDELGALATAFDRMVVNLRAAHHDLSAARADVDRILESMPDAVLVVVATPEGRMLVGRANRAASAMLGWEPEELVDRPLESIVRDADALGRVLLSLDATAQLRDRDTVYLAKSGRDIEVRLSASLMRGSQEFESYVLVASDITEVRCAERRRVASYRLSELIPNVGSTGELVRGVESVLRSAIRFDSMHAVIGDADTPSSAFTRPDGKYPGLCAFALQAEGTLRLGAADVHTLVSRGDVAPSDAIPAFWASAALRVDGRTCGILGLTTLDPHAPFAQADLDLLVFAAEQMCMALRRRRAEEERTRLATAVEHAVDAILVLDGEGRVVYANPAHERQSSYDRAEILGRRFDEIWNRGAPESPRAAMWNALRAGLPWSGPMAGTRRDGRPYHVDTTISAVRDDTARVIEFVVVQHDVSAVRTLEDQLRQSQKMEAVGLLAGGVAHDFNNLLSVILGYGELLRPMLQEREQVSHLAMMTQAGERATSLVGQLLAFSRRTVIEPRSLDLRVAVGDMQKMLRRIIREDVELVAELPETLDLVEADAGQIEQLLMNLAVNARDAMPHGGRLTIRLENVLLDDSAARLAPGLFAGPHVAIVVSDTGTGMPDHVRDRAFEPFFTTKARGQGTGLGLSTVYGIVQQARGHIAIESAVGVGTTFRIHLPSAKTNVVPVAAEVSPEVRQAGSETILVVEDESALRSFVVHVLTGHGYRVIDAADGAAALEISRTFDGAIDLLLTDVVMPRMRGTALADAMRRERPDLQVLFMSGYADGLLAERTDFDPESDLVQKPFTAQKLLRHVRARLDGVSAAASSSVG